MSLQGKRIAILAGPDYEDLELHYPYLRLIEAGAELKILAATKDTVKGRFGLPATPHLTFDEAKPLDYDAVVVPGGWAPDRVRRSEKAVNLVKTLYDKGRLVAAICHGPQVLISAKILKERKATCVSAIKDDIINAGAQYLDQEVVVDRNLITSRTPADLPAFCREILRWFSKKG
jgi:protease I